MTGWLLWAVVIVGVALAVLLVAIVIARVARDDDYPAQPGRDVTSNAGDHVDRGQEVAPGSGPGAAATGAASPTAPVDLDLPLEHDPKWCPFCASDPRRRPAQRDPASLRSRRAAGTPTPGGAAGRHASTTRP